MSKIFISHSSRDNFAAVALTGWLAENGWSEVFLDLDVERGIQAGERWEAALHAAAQRCEAVIFLISSSWLKSGWCGKEFALARGLNKKLFAVLIEPGLGFSDLPPEYSGTWQAIELTGGDDLRIIQAKLPGSHEQQHVSFSQSGLRRLKNGLNSAGLDAKFFAWPPTNDPNRAPYRGLRALEEADAGVFFGRDAPIVIGGDRLRGLGEAVAPRIFVILGASGAGKSSYLRAGLLPRLRRDDSHFVCLPPIRPERAAISGDSGLIAALEKALVNQTRASIRTAVAGGAASLKLLLRALAQEAFARTLAQESGARKPPAILISIDQSEELFRPDGAEESDALLEILRDLAKADDPAVILLFAIRTDSYDRLEHAPALEGMPQSALPLLPMPRGNYKQIIEGPAERAQAARTQLSVEPELTQRLLEEIDKSGSGDALPLLAFALEQLYVEYGAGHALRLRDFEALGGLEGAIARAVERAFSRADSDPRIPRERMARETLLRRGLVPWLAGIDPDTHSPRRNIARKRDIPAEARPLIELLVEERLLVADSAMQGQSRVETLEPAHEALLRQWGLLKGWLAEDLGLLATLEGVRRAARDWDANGRHEGWLAHQSSRLAEARVLDARPDLAAQLDARDRAYLTDCGARELAAAAEKERAQVNALALARADAERAQAQARGARNLTYAALAAALALAGVGGWAWVQRGEAIKQTAYAEAAATKAQAATADAQLQRDRAEKAVHEATEAANTLVFSMVQKLRDVAGMPVSLIQAILDPALKLQDDLIGSGEANPYLRRGQATALDEATETRLALGDTVGALANAEKSRDIMLMLVRQQPDNTAWQRDLSISYDRVGNVQVARGDLSDALQAYSAGFAIRERLAKSDPGNTEWQINLLVSYIKVGDAQFALKRLPEALKSFSTSLELAERLAGLDPDNTVRQRDLAASHERVGDVQFAQSLFSEALASYSASLAIRERLASSNPSSFGWQRDLEAVYGEVGSVQGAQGNFPDALQSYSADLAIAERLAKSDPGNAGWQRDLAVSYAGKAKIYEKLHDLSKARDALNAGRAIIAKLVVDHPEFAQWKQDLGWFDQQIATLGG